MYLFETILTSDCDRLCQRWTLIPADYVDCVLHSGRVNGGLALAGRSYPDVSSAANRIR
jgi:hypothetical protein